MRAFQVHFTSFVRQLRNTLIGEVFALYEHAAVRGNLCAVTVLHGVGGGVFR